MTPVDLHNKEFCVDVSAFKPLEWVEQEGESCSTEFVKQCEEKRENVCADVTETVCDVVPYTGMGGGHCFDCHYHYVIVSVIVITLRNV